MKNNSTEIRKKLNSIRGQFLSEATQVEFALGWRLRTYFYPKTNRQAGDFYWHIINDRHFTFERKISLYEAIPYFKGLKQYSEMVKSLRLVQKVRNALAHWDLEEGRSSIKNLVLWNPTNLDRLHIDKNLQTELKKSLIFILKNFGWRNYLIEIYGENYNS